jgi:hypothetical protein
LIEEFNITLITFLHLKPEITDNSVGVSEFEQDLIPAKKYPQSI